MLDQMVLTQTETQLRREMEERYKEKLERGDDPSEDSNLDDEDLYE